jgi:hypothetical protein
MMVRLPRGGLDWLEKWGSQLLAGPFRHLLTFGPHATREEERKRRRPNRRPAPAPDCGASEAAA